MISKTVPGENAEKIKTRTELACDKIRCEANIMKIRSESYEAKLARIDDEIDKEIYKHYEEESEVARLLLKKWKNDCKKEDEVSNRIWKDKQEIILKISYKL